MSNCYRVRPHEDGWSVDFEDDPIALFASRDEAAGHAHRTASMLSAALRQGVCVCVDGPDGQLLRTTFGDAFA